MKDLKYKKYAQVKNENKYFIQNNLRIISDPISVCATNM